MFHVTHADRAAWQRRSAAELVRILDVHRDLPLITWTVGVAGSVLVGRVATLEETPTRTSFDSWRVALALAEHHERSSDTMTYLSAKDDRNSVRIVLLADLSDEAGGHR
jgi:hypothetical protein